MRYRTAPPVKRAATEGYGARVVPCEPTLAARESTVAEQIERHGLSLIHPYDDWRVIAGQATAAWELLEFLSTPAIQRRFYELTGDLPPRRSSWQSGAIATDPYTQAFRTQLERLRTFPQVPEWEEIMQEMRIMAERVAQGQQDVDSAVNSFDVQVDDMLAKRRWMLERQQRKAAANP